MAKVEEKIKESDYEEFEKADTTEIEVITDMVKVHSPIQDNISKDFVYAKLGQDGDAEGVSARYDNGDSASWIFDYIIDKTKKWKWNSEKLEWYSEGLSEIEINKIKKVKERVYTDFMKKAYMTVILNRNVEHNYILRHLSKVDLEDDKSKGVQIIQGGVPDGKKE